MPGRVIEITIVGIHVVAIKVPDKILLPVLLCHLHSEHHTDDKVPKNHRCAVCCQFRINPPFACFVVEPKQLLLCLVPVCYVRRITWWLEPRFDQNLYWYSYSWPGTKKRISEKILKERQESSGEFSSQIHSIRPSVARLSFPIKTHLTFEFIFKIPLSSLSFPSVAVQFPHSWSLDVALIGNDNSMIYCDTIAKPSRGR